MNPRNNGSSSNLMILYQELEDIVYTNDYNHSRIEQLRRRIANWVIGSALSSGDIADLQNEIQSAPVAAFRPQLWRIELANIHISRLINLGQFPDEYQIQDLRHHEFEVIVS